MTFSLLARDPAYGDLGIAIASRYPGVGGVVPYYRRDVGLVASQSYMNAALAEALLDALAQGATVPAALTAALAGRQPGIRQVLVLTAAGGTAVFTGGACTPEIGEAQGPGCVAAGNMLASARVAEEMILAYADCLDLPFADRLLHALQAGEAAGGDMRGREAAAIRIWPAAYPDPRHPSVDLRADHDDDPLGLLATLLRRWREVDG